MIPYNSSFSLLFLIIFSAIFITLGCGKENEIEACFEKEWYQDNDRDGLGNPAIKILACNQPEGYVSDNTDSNDAQKPLEEQNLFYNINSINLLENYPLRIYLPAEYDSDKNLPVLYVLDGKTYYEDLKKYIKEIGLNAIIVGIGDHLSENENDLRRRDFLPGFSFNGVEGGHLKFYNFLVEEVLPYVDTNYDNNQNARALIGHHASGLFVNFSMLNQVPDNNPYFGFISINAEIYIPKNITDKVDDTNFSTESNNVRLQLTQVSSTTKAKYFYDLLVEKPTSWLDLNLYTLEDENTDSFNPSIVEPSIKEGLKFIYNL